MFEIDSISKNSSFKINKPLQTMSFPSKFITEGTFLKTIPNDNTYNIKNFTPVYINHKQDEIGKGIFSKVYLYKSNKTNQFYAVKNMKKSKIIEACGTLESIYKEISIQSRIIHKNIIRLFASNETENEFNLVMEYAEGGNLFQLIHNQKGLSEGEAFKFFIQVVNAIYFLHEHNYIHRDIKPENLLIQSEHTVKLCDFGWCREVEIGNRKTFCGTFEYMAPEIIKEEPYNKSIDIWALGVLLYEMIYGYSPFKAEKDDEDKTKAILTNVLNRKVQFEDKKRVSDKCKEFILKMIEPNVDKRYTIKDILMDEYVKEYEYKMFKDVGMESDDSLKGNNRKSNNSSGNNYSTNRNKERDKEDEQFFQKVISQITTKRKRVKRGTSIPRNAREIKSDNKDSEDNNKEHCESEFNVNPERNIKMRRNENKQPEVHKVKTDVNINEFKIIKEQSDDFLKEINRDNSLNVSRPAKKTMKQASRIKSSKETIIDDNFLTESICIVEKSKKTEVKVEKEESFWDKLFKNFKCE